MKTIVLLSAIISLIFRPIQTLSAILKGARSGWVRGVAGSTKEQMPNIRGRVLEIEVPEEDPPRTRPPHRTYGFSHQIIDVGDSRDSESP